MPTKSIPEGFHAITPYLFAQGASRLIEFIVAAFGFALDSWHLEFLPASFLLVGWNILDVGGHPPNVAAGVFDTAIPFTGRQCHDRKNGSPAGVKRTLVHSVAIGDVQVN